MSYLGQVGGLADPVDTTEGDHVGTAMALGIHDITENVDAALGLQDLHKSFLQGLLHRGGHRWGGGGRKRTRHAPGNTLKLQTARKEVATYW